MGLPQIITIIQEEIWAICALKPLVLMGFGGSPHFPPYESPCFLRICQELRSMRGFEPDDPRVIITVDGQSLVLGWGLDGCEILR